jgi:hypothetical protein
MLGEVEIRIAYQRWQRRKDFFSFLELNDGQIIAVDATCLSVRDSGSSTKNFTHPQSKQSQFPVNH